MKEFIKTSAGILLLIAGIVGFLTLLRYLDRQPSVVLTDAICEPPCWHGIQPGKTNVTQVFDILDGMESVNQATIAGEDGQDGWPVEIFWAFQRPAEDSTGSVFFKDRQVTAISILTVNSLSLEDLFEKYGQPEQYWAEIGYGENREYLDVVLLFPTRSLLADVVIDIADGASQVEIKPTTPVFRVTYFDPQMFAELLGTRILIDKPASARTGSFQTWPGFGIISFERK